MFVSKHLLISRIFFLFALILGTLVMYDVAVLNGWIHGRPLWIGWSGWLFWSLFIAAVIKLKHPPVPDMTPLDSRRTFIGWLTVAIFILSFSPMGIFDVPEDFQQFEHRDAKPGVPVMQGTQGTDHVLSLASPSNETRSPVANRQQQSAP